MLVSRQVPVVISYKSNRSLTYDDLRPLKFTVSPKSLCKIRRFQVKVILASGFNILNVISTSWHYQQFNHCQRQNTYPFCTNTDNEKKRIFILIDKIIIIHARIDHTLMYTILQFKS